MTFRRLMIIAVGYVAATCVAACIIVMGLPSCRHISKLVRFRRRLCSSRCYSGRINPVFAAVVGLVPFLIARAYAERKSITSPTWYVGAGAFVGVFTLSLSLLLSVPRGDVNLSDLSNPVLSTLSSVMCVAAVAGSCAGFTYWLIAVQLYRNLCLAGVRSQRSSVVIAISSGYSHGASDFVGHRD